MIKYNKFVELSVHTGAVYKCVHGSVPTFGPSNGGLFMEDFVMRYGGDHINH